MDLFSVLVFKHCEKLSSCPFLQPLKNDKYRIFKSRYDSIDSYLSSCGEKYNDIDLTIDEDIYKQLLDGGTFKFTVTPVTLQISKESGLNSVLRRRGAYCETNGLIAVSQGSTSCWLNT
jgi:hypothetical protein